MKYFIIFINLSLSPAYADQLDDAWISCLAHWNHEKGKRADFEEGLQKVCDQVRTEKQNRDAKNLTIVTPRVPNHPQAENIGKLLEDYKSNREH